MQKILILKQARLLADIKQDEMAKALGVSRYIYMKLEKNPDLATIAQAKAISDILKVSYDEIFFGRCST